MRCQYCNCAESKVIDSRPTEEGNSIRRRRECMGCGRRFTTYEKIEMLPLMVVKRDGRRETFDAQKIKAGILHACEKLPVSMQQIDAMTTSIEQRAYASMEGEISSQRIGDMLCGKVVFIVFVFAGRKGYVRRLEQAHGISFCMFAALRHSSEGNARRQWRHGNPCRRLKSPADTSGRPRRRRRIHRVCWCGWSCLWSQ